MIRVCAPGSVMLLGEHAVLQGFPAVVCAADYRVHVILTPREDNQIIIRSTLGTYITSLQDFHIAKPFTFVLTAIQFFLKELAGGFDLSIQSDFSHEVGLGSSAAVTVATVAALQIATNTSQIVMSAQKQNHSSGSCPFVTLPCSQAARGKGSDYGPPLDMDHEKTPVAAMQQTVFSTSLKVIRQVQGMGSGADVAASVYGGVIAYQVPTQSFDAVIENLPLIPALHLFYSGGKMPTPEVLKFVAKRFEESPETLKTIYAQIGECTQRGIKAIKEKNWQALGTCFNAQQNAMTKLGVTNEALQLWIDRLNQEKNILGAKISGSGLGDCVVALGEIQDKWLNDKAYIALPLSKVGCCRVD